MLTTVCLIRETDCTADTPHAAAYTALCYEKSINLKTFPSEFLSDSNAQNALVDFIISENITYLMPVTQTAANLLANISIPTSVIVLTHALHLYSISPKCHEPKFIAYTRIDGHLHFLTPSSSITNNSLAKVETQMRPSGRIMALANKVNQHCNPRAGWGFDPNDISAPIPISTAQATLLRQLGINLWLLPIFERNGHPISLVLSQDFGQVLQTAKTELSLTINRLYLDMDDTLYVHDKANPHILDLLKKCADMGCPVSLITRHFQEPNITLTSYNIPASLFDEILWITDGSPKSSHIKPEPNTLFIDDSFHERQEVYNTLNIKSFSPDIAEILLPV